MPIAFSCSGCKATLQMADEFAGKKVRCPKCKAIAEVPILAVEVSPAISEAAVQPARDPLPAVRPEQRRDDAPDERRRPARRSSPPPERKSRAVLNRIFGGVGVVWGGAIIAYWYLGPKADGAYGTSQIAAMVFGACMFAAGLWYVIIGDRSAPKARPISNSDTDDLPSRPTGSDDRPEPRSGLPRRSSAPEPVGARSSGRYKTILGILGGSYLLLMILETTTSNGLAS